jgi:hypothetical protein
MSVESLMIRSIDTQFTAEYIAKIFWNKEIAIVSSVTLIPQILNEKITNIAYINFETYCDTEAAYDFICRIRDDYLIFEHDYENNCWIIEKNTHNDGNLYIENFTKVFNKNYYQIDKNDDGYLSDSTDHAVIYPINDDDDDDKYPEWAIDKPIKGLRGDRYNIEEAYQRLLELKTQCTSPENYSKKMRFNLKFELDQLENEIRIHHAIEDSKFVTLRKNQYRDPFDRRVNKPVIRRPLLMTEDEINFLKLDLLC